MEENVLRISIAMQYRKEASSTSGRLVDRIADRVLLNVIMYT
jgi:hypothetical protein